MRKRRHETQGLGSQGLVICLDTKSTEMPADRPRRLRTYDDENPKASLQSQPVCWVLRVHLSRQVRLSHPRSLARCRLYSHTCLCFGISHHTPDSPADSPCRFSVFRLLTVLIESNFTDTSCGTSERRRDVKTREMLTEPAMLPSLLGGELKMEQRYPVPTRPSLLALN